MISLYFISTFLPFISNIHLETLSVGSTGFISNIILERLSVGFTLSRGSLEDEIPICIGGMIISMFYYLVLYGLLNFLLEEAQRDDPRIVNMLGMWVRGSDNLYRFVVIDANDSRGVILGELYRNHNRLSLGKNGVYKGEVTIAWLDGGPTISLTCFFTNVTLTQTQAYAMLERVRVNVSANPNNDSACFMFPRFSYVTHYNGREVLVVTRGSPIMNANPNVTYRSPILIDSWSLQRTCSSAHLIPDHINDLRRV